MSIYHELIESHYNYHDTKITFGAIFPALRDAGWGSNFVDVFLPLLQVEDLTLLAVRYQKYRWGLEYSLSSYYLLFLRIQGIC